MPDLWQPPTRRQALWYWARILGAVVAGTTLGMLLALALAVVLQWAWL